MTLSTGSSGTSQALLICGAQDPDRVCFKSPQSNAGRIDGLREPHLEFDSQGIIAGSTFKENQKVRKKERVIEYKYFRKYSSKL